MTIRSAALPDVLDRADEVMRSALRALLPNPAGSVEADSQLLTSIAELGADAPNPQALHEIDSKLPRLRHALELDVLAAVAGDPACQGPAEAALCYPGVHAVALHRLAHRLWRLGMQTSARLLAERGRSATGIDIHPAASIGSSFFIDHGIGVVIGQTANVGAHVKLYQGVTLGAVSTDRAHVGNAKRHPTVEDHVTIYANATILGGDTVIGAGAIIGAGVFLTRSVPPRHVARNPRPKVELRPHGEDIPLDFTI
ncbi:MAG: serine O-acetyltransferase EpsC [Planctomycetota bacterium]